MNPRIIALLAVLASAEQALAGDPAGLAGHPGKTPSVRAHKPGHSGDNRPYVPSVLTQFGDPLPGLTAEQLNLSATTGLIQPPGLEWRPCTLPPSPGWTPQIEWNTAVLSGADAGLAQAQCTRSWGSTTGKGS